MIVRSRIVVGGQVCAHQYSPSGTAGAKALLAATVTQFAHVIVDVAGSGVGVVNETVAVCVSSTNVELPRAAFTVNVMFSGTSSASEGRDAVAIRRRAGRRDHCAGARAELDHVLAIGSARGHAA